ncbi:MAG TPA: SGNH/GDSL hydrolase family protein [Candidatus Binatia bacterium]|nr:SGNH/GDSL hydrolase family protein [Candidatus Binatia bacterium]
MSASTTVTPATPKKKHGFLRGVLVFIILCLLFEGVLRLFGYGHYTIYRPDEQLLWVPVPGRTLTVVNHLPITINNQGMRYPVDLTAKQPDQFRVIAFGDSSTQGWGVDDNSTYSADIEKALNQGNCTKEHFQAVSAGVNAYPNSLVAEKLKLVVEDPNTRPDVAIVAYSYNSNFEKLVKLQGADREKFLRRVEWKSIARRSAIYNYVIEDLLRRFAYYRLRHLLMAGTLDTLKGMDDLDMDQFNQNLVQELALAQKYHVQLVYLMLGSDGQTPQMPMHPFQTAMINFAAKNNVPMVNMIPIISTKDQSAMFMDPAHPTVAGHQIIANELLKTVETLPNYEAACGTGTSSASAATPTQTPAVTTR